MRVRWLALIFVVSVFSSAVPAVAQQSLEVEGAVGLDGYVDPDEPTDLTITVRSPSLFVGSLEVSMRNFQTSVPLEVPADGLKEVVVGLPPPGSSPNVMVRILDGSGNRVLDRDLRVPLDAGFEQILTGVIGSGQLSATLGQVRSRPLGLSITPVSLESGHFDQRLSALDYIVSHGGALAGLSQDEREAIAVWVEGGGRLVANPSDAASLSIPVEDRGAFGPANMARVARGEILVVPDVGSVALDEWPALLRDVPQSVRNVNDVNAANQAEFNLIGPATAGGSVGVPQLPWLAAALAFYGILVGPVNFFLLRRLRRPELAWVTIPAVSILAVALFWLNGPRGDRAEVNHASVVVFDGDRSRAETGLVMVSGAEGVHRLSVPGGWSLMSTSTFGRSNVVGSSTTDAASSIEFDLESLEAATAIAGWQPSGAALRGEVTPDGNNYEVTVTNESPWDFWAWGVVSGFDAAGRNVTLRPGDSASATLRLAGNADPWEPPMARVTLQGGNFNVGARDPWEVVYPLSQHLAARFRDSIDGVYLFGFTDDIILDVAVDGEPVPGSGTSLVIVPLRDAVLSEGGVTGVELLYAQGADWVEPNGFSTFIGGAEAVFLRTSAPDGATSGSIRQSANVGFNNDFAVYDWEDGEFVELTAGNEFSGGSLFTPTGELLIRLTPAEEFSEVIPDTVRVEWNS